MSSYRVRFSSNHERNPCYLFLGNIFCFSAYNSMDICAYFANMVSVRNRLIRKCYAFAVFTFFTVVLDKFFS